MVSEFTPRFLAAAKARDGWMRAVHAYHTRVATDWIKFGKPTGRESAPAAARVFDMYWQWFIEDIAAITRAMIDETATAGLLSPGRHDRGYPKEVA